MFENSLLRGGAESQKPWSVAVSLLAQSLLVCIAVLVSLLSAGRLPAQRWMVHLLAPPPLPPPAAAAPQPREIARTAPAARFDEAALMQPAVIPERIALVADPPGEVVRPAQIVSGSSVGPGVIPGTGIGSLPQLRSIPKPVVAPPQDPEPPAAEPKPVSVGGRVQAAKLIDWIEPEYPPLARQAGISGLVKLQATIAPDGTVRELRVISGHPLLIRAAESAVRTWRYRPTLLNGVAVPVSTMIEVHFRLGAW
jgi:protein TonB